MSAPYGAIAFGSTMVAFIFLRKIGMEHLLREHSGEIGVGVAWIILSSVTGWLGYFPEGVSSHPSHLTYAFTPQQLIFVYAMFTRNELTISKSLAVAILLICGASMNLSFFMLVCGFGIIATPEMRLKVMLAVWAIAMGIRHTAFGSAGLMIVACEELTLLALKMQWTNDSTLMKNLA